jgi:hypothetical protein
MGLGVNHCVGNALELDVIKTYLSHGFTRQPNASRGTGKVTNFVRIRRR